MRRAPVAVALLLVAPGWIGARVCLAADPTASSLSSPGGLAGQTGPSGASGELDQDFLNLPAYDFERMDAGAKLKVGDWVIVRVQGLGEVAKQELKFEVPPGTDALTDLGWNLETEGSVPAPTGEFRVRVTPLKGGRMTLPSLAIKDASGKSVARTNPLTLEVESAIPANDPKPEEPADLKPPVSLRFPWWVLVAAAILALLAIGGGVYAYRRAKGRKPKTAAPKPAEPPKPEDEVALAAFAELEKNGPLRRGEFKPHYFRVSEILKAYLGARFSFDASESTTRELIAVIEERRLLSDQQVDRLESLFERLDLVKFTDHVPVPEEGMRLLGVARDIVLATRRPPELLAEAKMVQAQKNGQRVIR